VRGIWNQHQVRKPRTQVDAGECRQVVVAPDVGVDEQERRRAEQLARLRDSARGLERLRLLRPAEREPLFSSVAQAAHDLARQVRNVDHDFANAGTRNSLEMPREQWLAAGLDERLRRAVGPWA
jgi:hypothetical protein